MGPFGKEKGVTGYIATLVMDISDETVALVLDTNGKKSIRNSNWLIIAKSRFFNVMGEESL
jgi:hypothetical protein